MSLRRRMATVVVPTVLLLLAGVGCGVKNAEFVMRDRPQFTVPSEDGETAYYLVHVGDTPTLAFRSKFAFCDYAIMHDEAADAYEDCGPDLGGAFEWPYTFERVTAPGEWVRLAVKGYATLGRRDVMPYNGKLMELELGADPSDSEAAAAEILVSVYQSRLVIPVDMGGKEPLWHAARLEMEGRGVRKRRIQYASEPRSGFFTAEEAGGPGRYRVVYEPRIKEIDPVGTTTALLRVPDEDGYFHDFEAVLHPPTGAADQSEGAGGDSMPADGAMQSVDGAS